MPLSLTTEEMDLLLTLAAPIEQRQRDKILYEVATELEAGRKRGLGPALARCIGSGVWFNGTFSIRRSLAKANIGALRSLFA